MASAAGGPASSRLNFRFGTKQGDSNCLDVMGALQGEGESLFIWGQTMAAFDRVVELCNREPSFQNARGEGLLSRSTVQKKLSDWITFFEGGPQGEQSITGSGGGSAKSHTMIQMEDLMKEIIECKRVAESRKGADPPGRKKHEVAAARDQLREAMTGPEPKQRRKRDAPRTDDGESGDGTGQGGSGRRGGSGKSGKSGSSNQTATDGMAHAASEMARAVAAAAKASAPPPAEKLQAGSIEVVLAERKLKLQEVKHADRHDLQVRRDLHQFELQKLQLEVMKAEISERAARFELELQRLRADQGADRRGAGGAGH
jgi:hypothetical protein